MKTIQLIAILFAICSFSFAQTNTYDVVYLKNGSVIKGVILEQSMSSGIKVQTRDESIFVFKWEDIDKVKRESTDLPVSTPPKHENDKFAPVNNIRTENLGSSGFYLGASIGYGFNALSDVFESYKAVSSSERKYSVDYHSFGGGFEFTAIAGYKFNANYGAEVAFNYQSGNDFDIHTVDKYSSYYSSYTNYYDESFTSSSISIVPTIVFTLPKATEVIQPFLKAGIVLSFPSLNYVSKTSSFSGSTMNYTNREMEYSSDLSTGSLLTIGSNFYVSKSICITGEIYGIFLDHKPGSYKNTKYIVNGVDQLPTLYDKVDLKDSYSSNDDAVGSSRVFSYSRIGIRCGLVILL